MYDNTKKKKHSHTGWDARQRPFLSLLQVAGSFDKGDDNSVAFTGDCLLNMGKQTLGAFPVQLQMEEQAEVELAKTLASLRALFFNAHHLSPCSHICPFTL